MRRHRHCHGSCGDSGPHKALWQSVVARRWRLRTRSSPAICREKYRQVPRRQDLPVVLPVTRLAAQRSRRYGILPDGECLAIHPSAWPLPRSIADPCSSGRVSTWLRPAIPAWLPQPTRRAAIRLEMLPGSRLDLQAFAAFPEAIGDAALEAALGEGVDAIDSHRGAPTGASSNHPDPEHVLHGAECLSSPIAIVGMRPASHRWQRSESLPISAPPALWILSMRRSAEIL